MSMIEKTRAYGNFVLAVKDAYRKNQTDSGLYIPDAAKKERWYRILATGPECKKGYVDKNGNTVMLKNGDLIQYYQGINAPIDGTTDDTYVFVVETNVALVIPKEEM